MPSQCMLNNDCCEYFEKSFIALSEVGVLRLHRIAYIKAFTNLPVKHLCWSSGFIDVGFFQKKKTSLIQSIVNYFHACSISSQTQFRLKRFKMHNTQTESVHSDRSNDILFTSEIFSRKLSITFNSFGNLHLSSFLSVKVV